MYPVIASAAGGAKPDGEALLGVPTRYWAVTRGGAVVVVGGIVVVDGAGTVVVGVGFGATVVVVMGAGFGVEVVVVACEPNTVVVDVVVDVVVEVVDDVVVGAFSGDVAVVDVADGAVVELVITVVVGVANDGTVEPNAVVTALVKGASGDVTVLRKPSPVVLACLDPCRFLESTSVEFNPARNVGCARVLVESMARKVPIANWEVPGTL